MKIDLTTVYDANDPPFDRCPFCGADEYTVMYSYTGKGLTHIRFDGEPAENGEMYECLKSKQIGKFAKCAICKKRLFRIKE